MEDINYEVIRDNNYNEPEEYCSTLEQAIYYVNTHKEYGPMQIVKVTREIVIPENSFDY